MPAGASAGGVGLFSANASSGFTMECWLFLPTLPAAGTTLYTFSPR